MAAILLNARWETTHRWYEVELVQDLLNDWTVMRRWGGKGSHRYGKKTVLVSGEAEGREVIEQIHHLRLRRKPAYWRVY